MTGADDPPAGAADAAEQLRLRSARIRRLLLQPGARLVPVGDGYALRRPAGRQNAGRQAAGRTGGDLRIDPAVFAAVARGGALTGDDLSGYRLARTARPLAAGEPAGPDPTCARPPARRVSAIDWLAARRDGQGRPWLTGPQVRAAGRLRRDHEIAAQAGARLTQTWSAAPRGPPGTPGDGVLAALEARARLVAALVAAGPGADQVLTLVGLQGLGLEQAAARLRLARSDVRTRLQDGLTRLAQHYGC